MNKKLLVVLLALAMVCAMLAGCSSQTATPAAEEAAAEPAAAEEAAPAESTTDEAAKTAKVGLVILSGDLVSPASLSAML